MKATAAALLLLGLNSSSTALAQSSPFSSFEVRTLTQEAKHLETGALICALRLEGASEALMVGAWALHFPDGPTRDDQLLVNSTIRQLCPRAARP